MTSLERTGWNWVWTGSLADWTADEMRAQFMVFTTIPLKKCDALLACMEPAWFYVDFHGCDEMAVCIRHKELWESEIERTLNESGEILCQDCGLLWRTMSHLVAIRRI